MLPAGLLIVMLERSPRARHLRAFNTMWRALPLLQCPRHHMIGRPEGPAGNTHSLATSDVYIPVFVAVYTKGLRHGESSPEL